MPAPWIAPQPARAIDVHIQSIKVQFLPQALGNGFVDYVQMLVRGDVKTDRVDLYMYAAAAAIPYADGSLRHRSG